MCDDIIRHIGFENIQLGIHKVWNIKKVNWSSYKLLLVFSNYTIFTYLTVAHLIVASHFKLEAAMHATIMIINAALK